MPGAFARWLPAEELISHLIFEATSEQGSQNAITRSLAAVPLKVHLMHSRRASMPDDEKAAYEAFLNACVELGLVLRKRLGSVAVISHYGTTHEPICRLGLLYEAQEESGGSSRLKSVTTYGRNNEVIPAVMSFAYSASLTGACDGCEGPYMVDMGAIPGVRTVRQAWRFDWRCVHYE
ncbi:MAG: hypothetical protein GY822_02540 [Deltaproteobacteria bacterium]|nr:hypothetical protein [Deltaproteobacteria bacterium]